MKSIRGGEKKYLAYQDFYERLKAHLESGKTARSMDMTDDELDMLEDVALLTMKPVIYAANVAEDDYANEDTNVFVNKIKEYAKSDKAEVMVISAKIEEEIAGLEKDEKQMFLDELSACLLYTSRCV